MGNYNFGDSLGTVPDVLVSALTPMILIMEVWADGLDAVNDCSTFYFELGDFSGHIAETFAAIASDFGCPTSGHKD